MMMNSIMEEGSGEEGGFEVEAGAVTHRNKETEDRLVGNVQ